MTKAKTKKNSGCANCDFYASPTYFLGHHRGHRCQNEKGHVEEHAPISGQYKTQTWLPKEQNKDCECPGFSDIEKKKKAADKAEKERIISIIEEYNKEVEDRREKVDQCNVQFVEMGAHIDRRLHAPKCGLWDSAKYYLFLAAGFAVIGVGLWIVLDLGK